MGKGPGPGGIVGVAGLHEGVVAQHVPAGVELVRDPGRLHVEGHGKSGRVKPRDGGGVGRGKIRPLGRVDDAAKP